MPGTRRPSLEQLLTTHQSTLETIIKTPRSGGDAEEAKAGINAIYELIGKEEPLTKDKVGAFVQQLGIVLPPAQLETMFAFLGLRFRLPPCTFDTNMLASESQKSARHCRGGVVCKK